MTNTLYLAVSGHGFGHAGQIAPVVNGLRERLPDLRVVIRSAVPPEILISLFGPHVDIVAGSPEPILQMRGPLDVDVEATWREYAAYHCRLKSWIDQEKALLRSHKADVVVADVPYPPIQAAQEIGIPAIALCSLNWADILDHYLPDDAGNAHQIVSQIRACYAQATCFIAPSPAMTMPQLPNRQTVGPIARLAAVEPGVTRAQIPGAQGKRMVLVTMGGIAGNSNGPDYPRLQGVQWIVPGQAAPSERGDITALGMLDLPFLDVLASSDVVVTKPGYGTIVEAACHGVPIVYVARDDWPENASLEAWLAAHAVGMRVERTAYERGEFADVIIAALQATRVDRVAPTGVDQAIVRVAAAFA